VTLAYYLLHGDSGDDSPPEFRHGPAPKPADTAPRTEHRTDNTDETLVSAIRASDLHAFESLFRTYHPQLLSFATGYVKSVDVAEEVVGDVFAWVWEHRTSWHPHTGIAAYLFSAVRNRAYTLIKQHARDVRRIQTAHDPDVLTDVAAAYDPARQTESDDYVAAVWRLVAALPERRRAIITLRWQYERSWDEIAAILGMTPDAARVDHRRALEQLRKQLRSV